MRLEGWILWEAERLELGILSQFPICLASMLKLIWLSCQNPCEEHLRLPALQRHPTRFSMQRCHVVDSLAYYVLDSRRIYALFFCLDIKFHHKTMYPLFPYLKYLAIHVHPKLPQMPSVEPYNIRYDQYLADPIFFASAFSSQS